MSPTHFSHTSHLILLVDFRDVLRAIQTLKVPCGVAALRDVSSFELEDAMEVRD